LLRDAFGTAELVVLYILEKEPWGIIGESEGEKEKSCWNCAA
jgi:hypothetical protein